jgi:hypothetical protein
MRRKITLWVWDDLPIPKKIIMAPRMLHPIHDILKQLEKGECFDWPEELAPVTRQQLCALLAVHRRATSKRFTLRTVPRGKLKPRWRIWRTS